MHTQEAWTQEKLEALIHNSAEESTYLEFKSGEGIKSDKKDIWKDVSAFANSAGGTIIYGISEENSKASDFSFIDGIVDTAERLEQIINDGIQRKIPNIKIHVVRFNGDIKKSVYVVEVPESDLAPHMTNDKKFYKRGNKISVQMEEYEIRQAYNKKQNITLKISDIRVSTISSKDNLNSSKFLCLIEVTIENIGKITAKDYRMKLFWPLNITQRNYNRGLFVETSDILGDSLSTINPPVIFPGEELTIMEFTLSFPHDQKVDSIPLQFFIYTDTGYSNEVIDIGKKVELQRLNTLEILKNSI